MPSSYADPETLYSRASKAALSVFVAEGQTLDDPEDLTHKTTAQSGFYTHRGLDGQASSIRPGALTPDTPPPHQRHAETLVGRHMKFDECSPRLDCDRYSFTAVPEALTISMLPPCPTWMDS